MKTKVNITVFTIIILLIIVYTYVWLYSSLGLISLLSSGTHYETFKLCYLRWLFDTSGLVLAIICLANSIKRKIRLALMYAIEVFGICISVISLAIRWVDYLRADTGRIFWFEPILRSGGYLVVFGLFIILTLLKIERAPEELDRK